MVSRQLISNAIRLVVPIRKSFSGARRYTCRCPQKQLRIHHDEEPGEPVVVEKPPIDSSHDLRSHHQCAPAYFLSFFAPPLVLAVPRNSFILFLRCLPVPLSACILHTTQTLCHIHDSVCRIDCNVRCCLEAFSTLVAMPYLTSL